MNNHNKAQQSKNRVHISCDILYHLTSIGIPMSKIRRSHDRLIFNMKILIPGKDGLYIRSLYRNGAQVCLLSWSLIRGSSGLDKRGPMMTSPLHAHTLCITWPVVRTLLLHIIPFSVQEESCGPFSGCSLWQQHSCYYSVWYNSLRCH